jgi:hypothetical protein
MPLYEDADEVSDSVYVVRMSPFKYMEEFVFLRRERETHHSTPRLQKLRVVF